MAPTAVVHPETFPEARRYRLPELEEPKNAKPPCFTLEKLSSLPFLLEAPLGALSLEVRHLLDLRPGTVLKLDRLTGEPLEITVNGTPIARGEVRIHGERFAIRVTEILRENLRDETTGGSGSESQAAPTERARSHHAVDAPGRAGR